MAIAFDNAGGAQDAALTTPWTVTTSFTIGGGSDRLLLVGSAYDGGAGTFTTTSTYNGVALTSRVFVDAAFLSVRIEDLRESAMPTAGAHNIISTWAADNAVIHNFASYDGVDDAVPEDTGTQDNGSGTTYSVSLTPTSDDSLIVSMAMTAVDTTHAATGSGAERHQENESSATMTMATQDKILATAAATTLTGTWGANKRNAVAGLTYAPATGGASTHHLHMALLGVG